MSTRLSFSEPRAARIDTRGLAMAGVSLLVLTTMGDRTALASSCVVSAVTQITAGCTGPLTNPANSTISVSVSSSGVISGGTQGVYNSDSTSSIATLTNNGTISGSNAGVWNSGSIQSIANSGNIIGIMDAIVVSGRVGTITNSGTIVSGVYTAIMEDSYSTIQSIVNSGLIRGGDLALYLSGSIGAVTNSGTIQAGIYSAGSSLTIAGVSGTVGTLTGGYLQIGASSDGTLVLAGGSQLLDDQIAASVEATGGATISMRNAVSIRSSYTQTSGVVDLGTSGTLLANGAVNLVGSTVVASLASTGNYLKGNTRTLVSGSSSTTYGALTTVNGPTSLDSDVGTTTVGGKVQLQLTYNNDYVGGSLATLSNTGTIRSVDTAVYVAGTGSIGTLTNSGTLAGNVMGVSNSGTIASLTNSSSIGGNAAVVNSGSITRLSNIGTVSGANYAIYNTGTIGTLTNSGVISGSVVNSGYLGLGGVVSISGNYSQGSGVLALGTDGRLIVSGTASIANATISMNAAGILGGQTVTLVSAAIGDYSGATVSITGAALTMTTRIVNNELLATAGLASGSYRAAGQTKGDAAGAIGAALDTLAGGGNVSADMQTILSAISGQATTAAQGAVIDELGPSKGAAFADMSAQASQLTASAILHHQETTLAEGGPARGLSAGAEAQSSAIWGKVLGGGASRDGMGGYRLHEFGLVAGAEHRLTDAFVGGVAASWVQATAKSVDASPTTTALDSFTGTAYGSYRVGALFIDGQAAVAFDQYSQDRRIDTLGRVATADFGGWHYSARTQAGYDVSVGGGAVLTPLAGVSFVQTFGDAYTESGAGADNLTVAGRSMWQLTQTLGARVGWSIDTAWGRFKPQLQAEWLHDYKRDPLVTTASIEGVGFATMTDRLSPDGAKIGSSATFEYGDDLSLRLEYDGELRARYQSHAGMLKAVWAF